MSIFRGQFFRSERRLAIITGLVLVFSAMALTLPLGRQMLPLTIGLNRQVNWNPSEQGVVVFAVLSPHCPISNASIPELKRIVNEFQLTADSFVAIVPGSMATPEEANGLQEKFELRFPVQYDRDNQLTESLNATQTPQVIVQVDGTVVYSGRIDDRFVDLGQRREQPLHHDLEDVLAQLRDRQTPETRFTEPVGCVIERGLKARVDSSRSTSRSSAADQAASSSHWTFNRDVAPVIFEHCSRCHRSGEVAPFPLMNLADVRKHADQIAVVVERGLMPPWKPEPGFASFRNEHRLDDRDRTILLEWLKSNRAVGNTEDLPSPPKFVDGWQLGEPDLIVEMPEDFEVPADGPDIYQHFVLPTGLTQNRLVNAVEFRPGAPEVVHHSIMYYDTSGQGRKLDAEDPQPGYARMGSPGFAVTGSLGGWGPGGQPQPLPFSMGRPIEKNADLIVQIHYHPIGRTVRDRSRIGLYLAPESATHPVTEIMVANVDLRIPPGETRHHHKAEYTLPVDTVIFDVTPHMHVLGREIRAQAFCPDGTIIPLIWIRKWDFYWQDKYVYESPLELPKGTRIELDCWFDNSADNPLNPNSPPKTVYWGDFSSDEMGICYFQATTRTVEEYRTLNKHATDYFKELWDRDQQNRRKRESK
ncbi:MAG: hypothetical protein JNM43_10880 [Planctomycetaceae bacterium]|nr:hypothetical protein [Planctomycetaceae bacterium]